MGRMSSFWNDNKVMHPVNRNTSLEISKSFPSFAAFQVKKECIFNEKEILTYRTRPVHISRERDEISVECFPKS